MAGYQVLIPMGESRIPDVKISSEIGIYSKYEESTSVLHTISSNSAGDFISETTADASPTYNTFHSCLIQVSP